VRGRSAGAYHWGVLVEGSVGVEGGGVLVMRWRFWAVVEKGVPLRGRMESQQSSYRLAG
jgi:hypothetical protein